MGKTFSVESFSTMKSTADQLKAHAETYTSLYTQLLQTAQTIGSWGGADQEAFAQKVEGLTTRLQATAAKLQAAGEILEAQKSNYVATQDALVDAANRLGN